MIKTSDPRGEELRRMSPENLGLSAWQRLCPLDTWRDEILQRMESYLDEAETRKRFDEHEASEVYPREILAHLRELGLDELLAPSGGSGRFSVFHMSALNTMAARRDTSVAVTLSVNFLGLLPAYLAATPDQIERISACIEAGNFSSLLLSELEHGSNILRNQAHAARGTLDTEGRFVPIDEDEACTHYLLNGEKHLINGATEHGLMFACLRTRNFDRYGSDSQVTDPMEARGDFTFFWLERGPGMTPVERYYTLPARAADISGLRFEDCLVPADRVLGRENAGLTIVHKTLMLSRGGVSALASGCLSRARDMAMAYAQRRNVYGKPIVSLGGISDHLMRMEALDMAVAAMSLKATSLMNSLGLAASHYTCVAKLMACNLAEEGVREGQRVLGARSLLRELPYERVIRDINLFGIFDGTSHVMLEELASRLALEARGWEADTEDSTPRDTIAELSQHYQQAAQPVVELLRSFRRPVIYPLVQHLETLNAAMDKGELAPLVTCTETLFNTVLAMVKSGEWKMDQGSRMQAGELFASIEVLAALAEVCDPQLRSALGMQPAAEFDESWDRPFFAFALSWLGARTIADLRQLVLRSGLEKDCLDRELAGLIAAEQELLKNQNKLRRACAQALEAGGARCLPS
ncbi:MAG: acyl-CoA dehydrogenase family protein [Planctomycetota bacterium]|jgi:alkylation response protein AidB-like acyl-CoA dehydrogenase